VAVDDYGLGNPNASNGDSVNARKYAGVLIGLCLSLVVSAAAMAATIGPNQITNKGPGWTSETYHANSQFFDLKNCSSSDSSLIFDTMRHWGPFPSTGIHEQGVTCSSSSTYRTIFWDKPGWADYNIEYPHWVNSATITAKYRIRY
jgi:hypothetical protein